METINLRPAISADAELVFAWRNALTTRQYFFDPRPLKKEEHIDWFEKSLKMTDRCLLIAELNTEPVGVLRYDFKDTQAEVNIYVAPHLIGKGLGTKMLRAGTTWIKTHFKAIKNLRAQIMTENISSLRAFEKAGFISKIQIYEKKIETSE